MLFSWAGSFHEFTGLPLLIITVETVIVAVIATVAAIGVTIIQRRRDALRGQTRRLRDRRIDEYRLGEDFPEF